MSKTLEAIRKLPHIAHVAYVDDERGLGNSIIITLHDAWCFTEELGCGVRGFDTVAEARAGASKGSVYQPEVVAI